MSDQTLESNQAKTNDKLPSAPATIAKAVPEKPMSDQSTLESNQTKSTDKAAGAPSAIATPAPEKPWATPAALRRCAVIAGRLEKMHEESLEYCSTGRNNPPQSLYQSIEAYFESLVADPEADHPSCTWKLLDFSVEFAKEIYAHLVNWRMELPPKAINFIAELSTQLDFVRAPKPPQKKRVIQLETLAELDKLPGISAHQICKIYGKFTPEGQPDIAWLRDARDGKAEVPRYQEIEPPIARMPHIGLLDALVGDFRVLAGDRGDVEVDDDLYVEDLPTPLG
jgi:hypothetical protein